MLGHDKLINFFKTNFSLMQHHKYSLHDIEHMMPWERIVYVELLRQHIKEIEQQNRDRAAANRRR
jgi:hypothetical protein